MTAAAAIPRSRLAAWIPILATGLLLLGYLPARLGPVVLHQHMTADDSGQHVWWAQRAWGGYPAAYDEVAEYFASSAAAPPAWYWLMQGLGRLGELQRVAELTNAVVVFATAWVVFALGRRATLGTRGPAGEEDPAPGIAVAALWAGLGAVALYLFLRAGSRLHESILLQRSFATILFAGTLWALISRRIAWLAVVFVSTALVYPVLIAAIGLTAIVHECVMLARTRRLPRGWIVTTVGGLIALTLILVVREVPDRFGPMVTAEQARQMAVFGPEGRSSIWGTPWMENYFTHSRTGIGFTPVQLVIGLLMGGIAIGLAGVRRVPAAVWVTAGVALFLWTAARLTLFDLYLPNRHTRIPLQMAWVTLIAAGIGAAALRWRDLAIARPRVPAGRVAQVTAALLVLAYGIYKQGPRLHARVTQTENPAYLETYDFLRQLPPEAVVAGFPRHVDLLSLRIGRPVLISRETTQAYYLEYYNDIVLPRLRDVIRAYYSPDWADVDRLYDLYGVRVIFYRNHQLNYTPDEEPFRSIALHHWRALGDREPALYRPPADRLLFAAGDVQVIRVGPPDDELPREPIPSEILQILTTMPPPPAYDPATHGLPLENVDPGPVPPQEPQPTKLSARAATAAGG
jgi:hypothetical protein